MPFTRDDHRNDTRAHIFGTVHGEADIEVQCGPRSGEVFAPESMRIEYGKPSGGNGPWMFYGVMVSGRLYKKNGILGLRRGHVYYSNKTIGDAPEWVRVVVGNEHPDPLLSALTGPIKPGIYPDGPTGVRMDALYLAMNRLDSEALAALASGLTDAAGIVGRAVSERIARERM